MTKLNSSDLNNLLTGSIFYGTGGGGSPQAAKKIYAQLNPKKLPSLLSPRDFPPQALFITTFTVGSLTQKDSSSQIVASAFKVFKSRLQQPIAGIIPVEIGPLCLSLATKLAQDLNLPLVNTDFVGGRSTPEVFLETITLFKIPRTPLVVANQQGDIAILEKSCTPQREEEFLRSFANLTQSPALVLGYPITARQAINSLALATVSQAIKVGRWISNQKLLVNLSQLDGKIIFQGVIGNIVEKNISGFTCKIVTFSNSRSQAKLYIKNENLVFWINDQPTLTCPDLIILLDQNDQPIYNLDLKTNTPVTVIGLAAVSLWRTNPGLDLFNPQLFGFKFPPKLLK